MECDSHAFCSPLEAAGRYVSDLRALTIDDHDSAPDGRVALKVISQITQQVDSVRMIVPADDRERASPYAHLSKVVDPNPNFALQQGP